MKRIMILSIALLVIGNIVHGQSTKLLANAAQDFLNTLSADELKITTYQLEDTLRTNWTNLPVGMAERPGIRYGDLSEKSKIQFQEILTTIFSSQGYLKTNNIMHLDDYIIRIYEIAIENKLMEPETMKELQALNWGHGNYYVSIYGNPGEQSNWGLKFEGHHLSINLTIIDGNISITPLFLGSDPALVRTTQFAGIRALSKEEDYGLELINLLNEQQKSLAIISEEFPMDIITSPEGPQRLTEYQGIKGEALNEKQKSQLKHLINEYIKNFERDRAEVYLKKLEDNGVDDIYFGWIGGLARETNHYYVINGPDFLIEYDNAGWIYKGDHIHTIFRDKTNDFGEDLLKQHYHKEKH